MINGISNSSMYNISTISPKQEQKDITEVEKSKVDTIKDAIKNGTYKIDIEQTSSKMAKSLL